MKTKQTKKVKTSKGTKNVTKATEFVGPRPASRESK